MRTGRRRSFLRARFFYNMSGKILAIVLLSVAGSTVFGMLLGILIKKIPQHRNDVILGFSAGVMLCAAMLGLIAPAFSLPSHASALMAVVGVLAGAALVSCLDKLVPHLHHIAGVDSEEHKSNRAIARSILFVLAIALHKIPESIAAGVSFGSGDPGGVFTVAGAISIQNIPESFVVVAPLLAVGISVRKVLVISLAIAGLSVVSVLAGVALVNIFSGVVPFMLACAGGAMIYVISDEMIPETHSHGNERASTFALIAGMLVVILLQRFIGA